MVMYTDEQREGRLGFADPGCWTAAGSFPRTLAAAISLCARVQRNARHTTGAKEKVAH